jgi:hypothetical protein
MFLMAKHLIEKHTCSAAWIESDPLCGVAIFSSLPAFVMPMRVLGYSVDPLGTLLA